MCFKECHFSSLVCIEGICTMSSIVHASLVVIRRLEMAESWNVRILLHVHSNRRKPCKIGKAKTRKMCDCKVRKSKTIKKCDCEFGFLLVQAKVKFSVLHYKASAIEIHWEILLQYVMSKQLQEGLKWCWWFPALSEDQEQNYSNSPKLSCGFKSPNFI